MKVLVVGSGGREHALVWKLAQSSQVKEIFCAPGNAGTARLARNLSISPGDLEGLLEFARSHLVDLTVVGPEAPLVAGLADRFQQAGRLVFGPSAAAARLEGSKVFAKDFMLRHGIPTAPYRVYDDPEAVEEWIRRQPESVFPVVVKADGLAAGKGVFICPDRQRALQAIRLIMREKHFGPAGQRVLIEEFLRGEEASFMVITDGERVQALAPSRDHKALLDGDRGPNTGGMGAYSHDSLLSPEQQEEILKRIILPAVRGMAQEGTAFRGVLYAGLMLTQQGPQVLEFNVRFGDPEAQVVLPRLEEDLAGLLYQTAQGHCPEEPLRWRRETCVCVVMASKGYPNDYETGKEISGLEMAEEDPHVVVFHAGTRFQDGKCVTAGGRVLNVTALADSLAGAVIRAYEAVNKIHFPGMHYRRDIAAKALKEESL